MAQACLSCLTSIRLSGKCEVEDLRSRVSELSTLTNTLEAQLQGATTELLGDSLETELLTMDKAIEEAARRIEVGTRFK